MSERGNTYDMRHSNSLEHCRVGLGYSSSLTASMSVDAAKRMMVIGVVSRRSRCTMPILCVSGFAALPPLSQSSDRLSVARSRFVTLVKLRCGMLTGFLPPQLKLIW